MLFRSPGLLDGHGPPSFHRPAEAPEVMEQLERISEQFGTRFQPGPDDVEVALETPVLAGR